MIKTLLRKQSLFQKNSTLSFYDYRGKIKKFEFWLKID